MTDSIWQRPKPLETIGSHSLGLQNLECRKAQQLFSKHMKLHSSKILKPFFRDGGIDFFYLSKNDIFLVAATASPQMDEPVANMIFLDVLQKLYDILKNCIGAVNEAYITVNRMLVFEILDEMTTFGYSLPSSYTEVKPFLTLDPIKPMIAKQDDIASRFFGINVGDGTKTHTASSQSKPKTPNSAYINIVEGLSAILGPTGEVCSSELWGKLTLISNLDKPSPISIEFNPDLVIKTSVSSLGRVAGAVHIETPTFHSCVDSSHFVKHQKLKVLPPTGQTRLMVYSLSDPSCINIPIVLIPTLSDIDDSKNGDKNLKLRLMNQAESHAVASYIQVKVQLPDTVVSAFTSSSGEENESTHYKNEERVLEWEVKKVGGRTEHVINSRLKTRRDIELSLPDIGPITLTFNLTQFSASGLVVKRAKVEAKNPSMTTTELAPQCFFGMSTKAVSFNVRTD